MPPSKTYNGKPLWLYEEWFYEWEATKFETFKDKEGWEQHGRRIKRNESPVIYIELVDDTIVGMYIFRQTESK